MPSAQAEKNMEMGCAILYIAPMVIAGFVGLGIGLYRLLVGSPAHESAGEALGAGAVFTVLAAGATAHFVVASRDVAAQRQRKADNPGAPWRWRSDWAAGFVRGKKPIEMIACWIATPLYGVAGLIVCVMYWELLYDSPFAFALLLYPLVGVALLSRALYTTLRWRKYGASTCELVSNPAVPGGEFQARVRTRLHVTHEETVVATLTCYHRYSVGMGSTRKTYRDIKWQGYEVILREQITPESNDTVSIPITIPIDSFCLPTTPDSPSDRIEWELSVRAVVSGINFSADYIVPVF